MIIVQQEFIICGVMYLHTVNMHTVNMQYVTQKTSDP